MRTTTVNLNGRPEKDLDPRLPLQNLLQFGGVCVEQAYYAEQVAKSLGIPARIAALPEAARAASDRVARHRRKQQPLFRLGFDQGRYTDDLYWSADITDPPTHQKLTDADVGLLTDLQKVDSDTRLLSAAL